MGGAVFLADVCLELDDSAGPDTTRGVDPDEASAEQGAGSLKGRPGQELPIDDRCAVGPTGGQSLPVKRLRRSFGMNGPVIAMNAGIRADRKIDAVIDPS